ncbi:MAG: NAD(P)-dependent dehydrogenase (short-subunit alcohol dehydrogenase family) [Oceanicoccus sp.]|jgi:NAD(P)-dependent dehydrogenase (short-subunit alcohol dehydrogenase family)
MNFSGKVCVITGGADGIGLGAAQAFKERSADVVLADINTDKLTAASVQLGVTPILCDVCSDSDVSALRAAASALGPVDVVMANAGVALGGRFEKIPMSEWQRLFDINVMGVTRTVNAFLPEMIERKQGTIIITGSSAGLFNSNGMNAPYASSKYALLGMAKALAVYCKPLGIQVHYLAPRMTDTAFPRSSVAWGHKGRRVTSDVDIGSDFDTVADVVNALFEGIEANQFLISLTQDTKEQLADFADSLSPF